MKYESATERAKMIRAELKRQGITSRMVSVRAEYFSMGEAVRVQIRHPAVPYGLVKELTKRFESIRRDPSGEILGGGNTYVTTSISSECRAAWGERYFFPLRSALAELTTLGEGSLVPVPFAGEDILIGYGRWPGEFKIWGHGQPGHDFSMNEEGLRNASVALSMLD